MRNAAALRTAGAIVFGIVFTATTFLGHLSPTALSASIASWRRDFFDPLGLNTRSWLMFKSQGDGVPYARLVFLDAEGEPLGTRQALESGVSHVWPTSADKLAEALYNVRDTQYLDGFLRLQCATAPEGTARVRYQFGSLPFPQLMKALIRDLTVLTEMNRELGIKDEEGDSSTVEETQY